ncbi:BLRF2 [Phascolarctid gammaherpesvirus 1]|uniref:BLRF2 n=1 Tax=Phascolarctid gammaherpesvirus 1 TaxID=2249313 RepID=A0A3S8D7I7_9GAMA|nr:BLRF2 [Phascolarctid gammaherpesvirus 1]AZB49224.1 BLRF2 [Phascolarctid gammaherpesvirus 1]
MSGARPKQKSQKPPKKSTLEDMSSRLAQLELEKKALEKRIMKEQGSDSKKLTLKQKEGMLQTALSKLTLMSQQLVETKLRNATAAALTEDEMLAAINGLNFKISIKGSAIDMTESEIPTRRPRSKSRSRAPTKSTN